jgi:hypothetical protein
MFVPILLASCQSPAQGTLTSEDGPHVGSSAGAVLGNARRWERHPVDRASLLP